jgi:hypothetical protein
MSSNVKDPRDAAGTIKLSAARKENDDSTTEISNIQARAKAG